MIVSELNALFDLVTKLLHKVRKKPEDNRGDSLATRYVKLFEKHGVHRNQIPRFTGNGLTVEDVQNDQSLMSQLTEDRLAECCDLFMINREWLDGSDETIFPDHFFYKHPEDFEEYVYAMSSFSCRLLVPHDHSNEVGVMVIEEEIGYVGDRQIVRYHISRDWPYDYWKTRVYAASCFAIASRLHTAPLVVWKPKAEIDKLLYSTEEVDLVFPGNRIHGDDLAESPEALTEGLRREEDKLLAIDLWQDLYGEGLMHTNVTYPNIVESFQSYRKSIKV